MDKPVCLLGTVLFSSTEQERKELSIHRRLSSVGGGKVGKKPIPTSKRVSVSVAGRVRSKRGQHAGSIV